MNTSIPLEPLAIRALANDDPAWNAFVAANPDATHPHLAEWAGVFERVFGHVSRLWAACDTTGAVRGVLPVTLVKSALLGRHAVSVPFLNYGGPIGDAGAIRSLIAHATADAQRAGFASIEMRSRRALPIDLVPVIEKVLVTLPLPATSNALMKGFDPKLRSQVRRGAKEGAVTMHGASELNAFYAVFAEHMRDLGTPVMPRAFFADVLETFGESVWIASVRHNGMPIAGAMGFRWGAEFEVTWASSLMRYKRMAPNMQLYWELMSRCIDEGVTSFNFGRTTPGSGPHRFKLQWGGVEEPLHWYHPGRTDAAVRPRKEDLRYALAAKAWSRLPLSIATALGPRIVRGIP